MSKHIAPYGSWKSPITAEQVGRGTIILGQVVLDGPDTYWLELRKHEGGRNVIIRRAADGAISDVTRPPFNARTRVHEYGGGSYTAAEGVVYFSNFSDGRLYRQQPGEEPAPLTPAEALRFADLQVDKGRNRLICVREDHRAGGEAINTLVALPLDRQNDGEILAGGNDFYASPCLSPDGRRLAWLTWNHPNMPWDGTELWMADIQADGRLGNRQQVAGGPAESIFQPQWLSNGDLIFVSDRSNWWNLYRWREGQAQPLCPMAAEFGLPQWIFGLSTYAVVGPEELICAFAHDGIWYLARLELTAGRRPETGDRGAGSPLEVINLPFSYLTFIQFAHGRLAFLGGSPADFSAVAELDLANGRLTVLRRAAAMAVDPDLIAVAEPIEFPTSGGRTAHALFYAPKNKDYEAPAGEKPPLLLLSHGGPTSAVDASLNWTIQYATSRGLAVVDVNYGGSTGYGREYRQRLNGQWGLVDVEDCLNAARHLVASGRVDGERLAIQGGSAGGYTTLCALAFHDLFKAGLSYFGVSDLELLARDTHKFESRYLDNLVGPYPEQAELYRQRSPIYHLDKLSSALILFQGLDDPVVPPNQSELVYEAVRRQGRPVAYVAYEGEMHGFRKAENIQHALESGYYFLARVFGFEPADDLAPVPIENLP